MADEATQVMVVKALPLRCFEIAQDFEAYPEWAADIKAVTVLSRDEQGRAVDVRYRAAAFGRSTSYTLRYDYTRAPEALSWIQVSGDLTNKLDGTYVFVDATDGEGPATEVTYHLLAELKIPIPGFIKRRAEGRIVHTALRDLRARVESAAA
jgi:hypothetical protein